MPRPSATSSALLAILTQVAPDLGACTSHCCVSACAPAGSQSSPAGELWVSPGVVAAACSCVHVHAAALSRCASAQSAGVAALRSSGQHHTLLGPDSGLSLGRPATCLHSNIHTGQACNRATIVLACVTVQACQQGRPTLLCTASGRTPAGWRAAGPPGRRAAQRSARPRAARPAGAARACSPGTRCCAGRRRAAACQPSLHRAQRLSSRLRMPLAGGCRPTSDRECCRVRHGPALSVTHCPAPWLPSQGLPLRQAAALLHRVCGPQSSSVLGRDGAPKALMPAMLPRVTPVGGDTGPVEPDELARLRPFDERRTPASRTQALCEPHLGYFRAQRFEVRAGPTFVARVGLRH